jgi:hypothetical protein
MLGCDVLIMSFMCLGYYRYKLRMYLLTCSAATTVPMLGCDVMLRMSSSAVLWIRNYFFRIRIWIWIPFSAEFWIRIQKKIVTDPDPDPTSKKFRIQFRIRP